MKTNCPNCGAVIEPHLMKCPYCGTRYVDLAISADEPFYLRYKYRDKVLTAKCRLMDLSLVCTDDTEELSGGKGNTIMYLHHLPQLKIDMHLQGINDNGILAILEDTKN